MNPDETAIRPERRYRLGPILDRKKSLQSCARWVVVNTTTFCGTFYVLGFRNGEWRGRETEGEVGVSVRFSAHQDTPPIAALLSYQAISWSILQ